jgi:hypothetical protein
MKGKGSIMFKKAERKQASLKIALTGPSGAGKTYSALAIATGMGKRIAVLDTENGSASLYSDKFEFDVAELRPPYTPKRYAEIIQAAVKAGYDVLLIDSLSPVWAGEGGVLDKKEELDSRGKGQNKWVNWRIPKAEHQKLKDLIIHAQIHIIVTMRSKQAYGQIDDGNGKSKVQKMGMAPIAEPDIEYEFTTVLDLDAGHKAEASKDRTGMFDGQFFTPTKETGEKFIAWLNGAKPSDSSSATEPTSFQRSPTPTEQTKTMTYTDLEAEVIDEDRIQEAYAYEIKIGQVGTPEKPGIRGRKMADVPFQTLVNVCNYIKQQNQAAKRSPTADEIEFIRHFLAFKEGLDRFQRETNDAI